MIEKELDFCSDLKEILEIANPGRDVLFTVVGINHYCGSEVFVAGQKVKIKKEPENRYDKNAIMVLSEESIKLGYVANGRETVKPGTLSASCIYHGIETVSTAEVLWADDNFVICKVADMTCYDLVYNHGLRFCDSDDYKSALEIFKGLGKIKETAEILKRITDCYIKLGQYDEAFQIVEKALEQEPGDLQCLMMKGVISAASGRIFRAIESFTYICERCSNDKVLMERSKCYLDMGDYEAALCDIKKALEINPQNLIAVEMKNKILNKRDARLK